MLIRIVRMSFTPGTEQQFRELFNSHCEKIRHFDGCLHLELHQDYDKENIFSTYSHWVDDEALENYRKSALFKEVWKATKLLFNDKPLAFSHRLMKTID